MSTTGEAERHLRRTSGRRRSRRVAAVAAASLALVFGPVAAGPAPSAAQVDSGSSDFFYNVSGGATPIFVELQREGYILDPILLLNSLDTQIDINSTGNRESFASLLNPGPLGDFPALVGLAVAGLPPIPYPGYPLTVRASHPADPSAVLGAGDIPGSEGAGANVRPATVRAEADEASVLAEGTGARMKLAAGLVEVGSVESRAFAEDRGSSVVATVESSFSDVGVADLVHIDTVETTVTVTVDGDSMRATSKTTVGRVTALGAEFALDDEGLEIVTILGLPAPPQIALDRVTAQLERNLAELGLSLAVLPGKTVEVPSDGSSPLALEAGGLVVSLPFTIPPDVPIPSIPGVPLGVPIGGGVPTTATVRLASAQVAATAGTVGSIFGDDLFSGTPDGSPTTPGDLGDGAASSSDAAAAGSFGGPSSEADSSPAGSGTEDGSTSEAAPPPLDPARSGAPLSFDFTPAFRWTMLAALGVLLSGWPLVRRRLAGRSLSAADLVLSLSTSSRRLHR